MAIKVDEFYLMDPANPPPAGTELQVQNFQVNDANDDGVVDSSTSKGPWWRPSDDKIDDTSIIASYAGDTVTVQLADGTVTTITGTTFYLADGRKVFTPTDGSTLQNATLVDTSWVSNTTPTPYEDLDPVCFVTGTMIETEDGETPVENLRGGEIIRGYTGEGLRLRKIFRRTFVIRDIEANPKLRPVRICAGALGEGLPVRDMLVSRQHRMLIHSRIANRMFGVSEVLVPAIKLTALPGIFVDQSINEVEYFHLLFDAHEVIVAEGAPTESLFTGPEALKSVSPEARQEILTIFPECAQDGAQPEPARFIPEGRLQKKLIERHAKNRKPLHEARP
ncbi:Hint domain-containing protein [Roseovarius salis]|uniref:Hint domain-containing protein n=1 Tax=Roseovarius salis TaxID=3376063 RepID=UPI0037CA500B